LLDIRPSAL